MKVATFFALCFVFGVALGQFEGSWTETKRNFGGSLYICVDGTTAHGSYSGAGLITGSVRGTTLSGEWYEAGYDRPFGQFSLVLAADGDSFTGTWTYFQPASNTTDVAFSWTGSRQSTTRPSDLQCLLPSSGNSIEGRFDGGQQVCVKESNADKNSGIAPAVFARLPSFGSVEGYSPDVGRSVLLSDFTIVSNDTDGFRPENNAAIFGPCVDCNQIQPLANINTDRIVIGALLNDNTFCGFFWLGLYNTRVSETAICYDRESFADPGDGLCTTGRVQVNPGGALIGNEEGNTALLLAEVQRAFDALLLPSLNLVQGSIADDDDDGLQAAS